MLRIFSPLKIRRLRPGLNPRTWVPKASTLPLDHRSRYFIYIKHIFFGKNMYIYFNIFILFNYSKIIKGARSVMPDFTSIMNPGTKCVMNRVSHTRVFTRLSYFPHPSTSLILSPASSHPPFPLIEISRGSSL